MTPERSPMNSFVPPYFKSLLTRGSTNHRLDRGGARAPLPEALTGGPR